jgi:hypothetical protein
MGGTGVAVPGVISGVGMGIEDGQQQHPANNPTHNTRLANWIAVFIVLPPVISVTRCAGKAGFCFYLTGRMIADG